MGIPSNLIAQEQVQIGEQNSYTMGAPIDYSAFYSHTQSLYPADVLRIPIGAEITSITFAYSLYDKPAAANGDIQVSIGEVSSVENETKFITENLSSLYDGPDKIDFTSTGGTITYDFITSYTYKGAYLIIDVQNTTPRSQHSTVWFSSNSERGCRGIRETSDAPLNGTGSYASCPGITINFTMDSATSVMYIPQDFHKINFGLTNPASSSEPQEIKIKNLGKSPLNISDIVCPYPFSLSQSVTSIPAQSEGVLSLVFNPTEKGSYSDRLMIETDGGEGVVSVLGSSYVRTPYSNQITIGDIPFSWPEHLKETATELSVTGYMDKCGYEIGHEIPKLKNLDLSMAKTVSESLDSWFRENKVIEQLFLPATIKKINAYSLEGCTQLKRLILPIGLEELGYRIFQTNTQLSSLVFLSAIPPIVNLDDLKNIQTIYVPEGCIRAYQEAFSRWSGTWEVITDDVLNGGWSESSIRISDDKSSTTNVPIDCRQPESHCQIFYPADLINLPVGTEITSVSFSYSIYNKPNDEIVDGKLKISVGEIESILPPVGDYIDNLPSYYQGSDLLDFSAGTSEDSYNNIRTVTYKFETPYIYKGGCLVLDLLDSRTQTTEYIMNFSYNNTIKEALCLMSNTWDGTTSAYPQDGCPETVFKFKTPSAPVIYLPYSSRRLVVGYAPIGNTSHAYLDVRNIGGSDLTVDGFFCPEPFFKLTENPTILPQSKGAVGFSFTPTQKGSFESLATVKSTGGEINVKLIGTTFCQQPYSTSVEVTKDRRLYQMGLSDTITELTITGYLMNDDLSYLRNFNQLRYLDLSTSVYAQTIIESRFLRNSQLERFSLPMNIEAIEVYAFDGCSTLEQLYLPVGLKTIDYNAFNNCFQLKALVSFALTPPSVDRTTLTNIETVYVPENAVDIYQATQPWSKKNIEIITDEILAGNWTVSSKTIRISDDQTYSSSKYPGGLSNIAISPREEQLGGASLHIEDDTPLTIDTLLMTNKLKERRSDSYSNLFEEYSSYSSLINNSSSVSVNEAVMHCQMEGYRWHFISFPFSIKKSDLKMGEKEYPVSFVIRRYDGGQRANAQNNDSNWQDVGSDDILQAGTGYIVQSNSEIDSLLVTTTDQRAISDLLTTDVKEVPLSTYASDNIENANWNFVGNPYPSYFNIHYMTYLAPILIWNGDGYIALSPVDDAYALRPLEAFFTQKPDDCEGIKFQKEGRQTHSWVEASQLKSTVYSTRKLINLSLGNLRYKDRSRVVINADAKTDYELKLDAAKFMSPKTEVPQLYSLDSKGSRYAINERPQGNGVIPLGVYIGEVGSYTLGLADDTYRQPLVLRDKLLNIDTDLTTYSYTFNSDKGIYNERFDLRLSRATDAEDVEFETVSVYSQGENLIVKAPEGSDIRIFSATGILLRNSRMIQGQYIEAFAPGFYIVKVGEKTFKVIIH